jgi:hypothetical protein
MNGALMNAHDFCNARALVLRHPTLIRWCNLVLAVTPNAKRRTEMLLYWKPYAISKWTSSSLLLDTEVTCVWYVRGAPLLSAMRAMLQGSASSGATLVN